MFAYRPPPCISSDGSVQINTNSYDQADLSVAGGNIVAGQNISVTGNTVSTTSILTNVDAVQFLDSASIESNSGQLVLHGTVTSGNTILLNANTHTPSLTLDSPGLTGTPPFYRQLAQPGALVTQPIIQFHGTTITTPNPAVTPYNSQVFTFASALPTPLIPYSSGSSYGVVLSVAGGANVATPGLNVWATPTTADSFTIYWNNAAASSVYNIEFILIGT